MPIAVDLTGYHGDAGLGLGSNPDINVPVGNLQVLNGTMRDMSLLANEKNMKLFQQKVKDRDQLEALILNNQTATGNIDPRDQKYFDANKALVEKAYDKWGGNFNDTDGFRKYQQAVTNLQDTAAHAQMRWKGIKDQEQELSKETLPSKIKARQEWLEKQRSQPFGEQIVPYQQLHDWSMGDILDGVNPAKGEIIDPNNPVSYETSTIDFGDILKNKRNDYLNNRDKADSMDQFFDSLTKYNPKDLIKTVDATDAQIDKYNQQRGFQKGQPGYVEHVNAVKDDNGNIIGFQEPKTSLAAKWALANNKDFVTKTPKFNRDILKGQYDRARLGLEEQRNRLQAQKVGIEASKANAYVKHMNAATKKIVEQSQAEGTDITKMYGDFVNAYKPLARLVDTGSGAKAEPAIFADELPEGYQFINGAVVNEKTGKVTPGELKPFHTTEKMGYAKDDLAKKQKIPMGRPYYIPKVVDAKTGKELDSDTIFNKWKEWKQGGFKGTKDEMMQILLKLDNSPYEMVIQGQNGTVNYSAMSQAARVANNLGGAKKGQENIINPPTEGPDVPVESNPSETNPENN